MRHLQSFRYVKAIVESGSIRGAADTLAISPSALNRHIQTLELDLDIQLFERLTRGVRLSPEGEIFYAYALSQLSGFARVRNQINNIRGLSIGSVKFGVSQDINTDGLRSLISDFQRDNANVDIEMQQIGQEHLFDKLRDGSLDLAMFVNPVLRRGLNVLHARDLELSAFVPNGIGLGRSGALKVYELQNMRLALPPVGTEVTTRMLAACERFRVDVQRNYCGPDVAGHLEFSHLPLVGCQVLAESRDRPRQIAGYKRLAMDPRDIGTCNLCLLSSEDRGLSGPAYKFQEILSTIFQ